LNRIWQSSKQSDELVRELGFHNSSIPISRTRPARMSFRAFSANWAN
jgi:hypothetical protein